MMLICMTKMKFNDSTHAPEICTFSERISPDNQIFAYPLKPAFVGFVIFPSSWQYALVVVLYTSSSDQ